MTENVNSEPPYDALIKRVKEQALAHSSDTIARFEAVRRRMWEALAGPLLPSMLKDRNAAESYLTHSDPSIRVCALCLMTDYWDPTQYSIEMSVRMALGDPDSKVRGVAVACLGKRYAGTNNREVGRLLARLVVDGASPLEERTGAYTALFALRGLPIESWPRYPAGPLAHFDFAEDVDWSFVSSFLAESATQEGV